MSPKPPHTRSPEPRRKFPRTLVAAALAAAGIAALVGCTQKPEADPKAAVTASNVTLTDAQKAHVQLYTVAQVPFRRTIESSGAVDFDNDQATSVLAPFSGPVSRLLVSAGDKVKKGQPLAVVESSDFAAAVSTYSKALATARTSRKLAEADQDLLEHNGVSQREAQQAQTDAANAEADRDAALQALIALDVDPQAIKSLQQGRPVSHIEGIIRSPISGTVAEKLITPGQLLQAGTTACFTIASASAWLPCTSAAWALRAIPIERISAGITANRICIENLQLNLSSNDSA